MKKNNIVGNVFLVTLSNVTTIISGIFIGFLLPKMISIDGYGYYKIFTLYASYIGLFTLGLHDGIILLYGGKDYEELDKQRFREYFGWYFIINLFFAILTFTVAMCWMKDNYRYIFVLLAINIMANNITGYFQQISQITQRFFEYSIRKIISSVVNIISISFMFGMYYKGYEINYLEYVAVFVSCNIVMAIWYIVTYRSVVFGKDIKLLNAKSDVIQLIKRGFPLTLANLSSLLILTLDRQFVSILFSTDVYASYAFAYNMLSLITVATSAISTVLYPFLKRTEEKDRQKAYSQIVMVLLVFVSIAMVVYFPLKVFVYHFLPKYADSIEIFRIILPGLGVSTIITVAMHNYYKAEGKNTKFFKISMIMLLGSFVLNCLAYMIFKSPVAISIASIVALFIWYVISEQEFVTLFGYKRRKNLIYLILYISVFYGITYITNDLYSAIIYIVCVSILAIVFYRKELLYIWRIMSSRHKS